MRGRDCVFARVLLIAVFAVGMHSSYLHAQRNGRLLKRDVTKTQGSSTAVAQLPSTARRDVAVPRPTSTLRPNDPSVDNGPAFTSLLRVKGRLHWSDVPPGLYWTYSPIHDSGLGAATIDLELIPLLQELRHRM